jgi:hypothetical protein
MAVVERIKRKLEVLQTLDKEFIVFGSRRGHQYKLRPTLTEFEIQNFENQQNFSLPQDYRNFLLKFGNGGAGPGYGLYPLQKTRLRGDPTQVFPYTKPIQDWMEIESSSRYQYAGALEILTFGCSYYALLILTGAERGRIWLDAEAYSIPSENYSGDKRPCDFLTWYEQWLDLHIYTLRNKQKPKSLWGFGMFI